jgi:hypothetical protein
MLNSVVFTGNHLRSLSSQQEVAPNSFLFNHFGVWRRMSALFFFIFNILRTLCTNRPAHFFNKLNRFNSLRTLAKTIGGVAISSAQDYRKAAQAGAYA